MDANDSFDADDRGKLNSLFANLTGQNDAYVMKCLCVPDKPGAGGTVVDHGRNFRSPASTSGHENTFGIRHE